MKLKLNAIILLFLGVTTFISCSFISNNEDENSWKQFRGNYRNGSSFDEGSLKEVTNIEPNLQWKQALGSGFSEILVSNDRVFTMISEKVDSTRGLEHVLAFDALSGKQLWKTEVDSMLVNPEGSGEGPRSTPAIDNKAIYSLSTYGNLTAISREDGKKLWVLNFLKEFENKPGWIYTSSPLLMGDEILIEVGGSNSRGFASINKKTGTVNWITGDGVSTYSSPTPAMIDDKQQVVFANGSTLKSFDQDGNQLWSYDMPF